MLALDALASEQHFELLFAGGISKPDPYVQEFRRFVDERPWCRYLDAVDQGKLKILLKGASLMVLPSLEDNCPMAVLEAMAAGVPVAAAAVGGIPELIDHGKMGLLFNPLDPASMAAATDRILNSAGEAEKFGATAQKVAKQRFDPEHVASAHLAVYSEVLQQTRH
jgi:glycosyltransferase involved in cell wall biosynthesis